MKQAMYIAEVQKVIGVNEVMDSMVATAERRLGPLANVQGGGGASALVAETLGELRAMNASCKQDEDVGILSEEQASERASERETGRRQRARARASDVTRSPAAAPFSPLSRPCGRAQVEENAQVDPRTVRKPDITRRASAWFGKNIGGLFGKNN